MSVHVTPTEVTVAIRLLAELVADVQASRRRRKERRDRSDREGAPTAAGSGGLTVVFVFVLPR